jgi:hypothetical protein
MVAACLTAAPLEAGQRGNGKGGGATHGPSAAASAHPPAPAPKAAPTTTTKHSSPVTTTTSTGATTKTAKHTPTTTTSTTATTTTTGKTSKKTPTNTTSTTNTGSATSTTTISPLAQKIASHPQLASRLKALLPAGMTLNRAATGFKNQGQFIAALHVSRNLGIPFRQLKADMTGPDHLSLGQSIQKRRSGTSATTEVHRAETQATEDLKVPKVGQGGGDQQ